MMAAGGYKAMQKGGAVALLGALSACGPMDDEASARAQVSDWVSVGETLYFQSDKACSFAVFKAASDEIKSRVVLVRDSREAAVHLRKGAVVGVDSPAASPDRVSKGLSAEMVTMGTGVFGATIAARPCMTAGVMTAFGTALAADASAVILAPGAKAVALLDRENDRVYLARGEI